VAPHRDTAPWHFTRAVMLMHSRKSGASFQLKTFENYGLWSKSTPGRLKPEKGSWTFGMLRFLWEQTNSFKKKFWRAKITFILLVKCRLLNKNIRLGNLKVRKNVVNTKKLVKAIIWERRIFQVSLVAACVLIYWF